LQDKKKDFSYVIGEILKHNRALKRLRLSSLDPAKDFSTLFNIFKNDERLLPYFHLSMQSGDDNVLKIMRRRHRRKHLIDFVEKARKINPDVSIGADIICGFPGETNLMFENTYNIIRDLKISHLHVFPYSNRPGTAAEKYTGQVRGEIIKRRARKLRELGDNNFKEHMNAQVGKYDEVLVETSGNKGHTRNYIEAIINEKLPSNKIIKVKLTGTKGKKLIGEMVS
jgi:threonylcarbamoyladenosine tRNA methylthiotransferase MtaB